MKRHQTNWSNLPTEVVRSIAGCLEEYADDLHNFRRTCKKWRQSTAISTILPLTINSTPRRKLYYSSVSLLRPRSHGDVPSSAYSPWMISAIETTNGNLQCCHPFNKTPLLAEGSLCEEFQSINLDRAYHLTQVDDEDEEVIEFDKVLLLSNRRVPSGDECGLLALHSGGRLGGYLSLEIDCELTWSEIKYRSITKFDDIIMYKGMILALTRQGKVYTIDENRLKVDSTLVDHPLSQVGRPRYRGCRRRLVNSNSLPKKLYLVERVSQCSFRVYNLHQEKMGNKWVEVKSFGENVLFVTRDYCFFVSASQFSTCCLKNCIVFSNDGFPRYGSGRTNWERSDPTKIFVFRVGGHSDYNFKPISRFTGFPLFLWSCPPWAWDKGSSSSCQFQRVEVEAEKDKEEVVEVGDDQEEEEEEAEGEEEEEAESDANSADGASSASFDLEVVLMEQFAEAPSISAAQERIRSGNMPSSVTPELEPAFPITKMPSSAAQRKTSRVEKPPSSSLIPEQKSEMPSTSTAQEKVARLEMPSSGMSELVITEMASASATRERVMRASTINEQECAAEEVSHQETSREENDIIHSVSRGYITSTTQNNESNNSTIKFKGLDIRSNFLQTLQNIWSKHGNLIENSLIRNGDMVSRALESLAQAILILEQTSVQSLSDSQVDYLKSTLSDLQCMRFKVDWLVPYVDKAVQLHKSKPLIDSRDQLLSCKAKVQERRSKLYEELAELDKLEKELEEDVANASKFIPVSGNVDMDQPIGWGLS